MLIINLYWAKDHWLFSLLDVLMLLQFFFLYIFFPLFFRQRSAPLSTNTRPFSPTHESSGHASLICLSRSSAGVQTTHLSSYPFITRSSYHYQLHKLPSTSIIATHQSTRLSTFFWVERNWFSLLHHFPEFPNGMFILGTSVIIFLFRLFSESNTHAQH